MLGIRDKRVIAAFIDCQPAAGHKLSTNGMTLDGHWMGGDRIAEWKDCNGRMCVVFHDLGSRAAQSVQRAVKKALPSRLFGGFNPHVTKWIAGAVKKSRRGALHRALHVPAGRKIPMSRLRSASHKRGKTGRRARLAMTLRRLGKHRKRR